MTVNKERVELLCEALESEKYTQCADVLKQEVHDLTGEHIGWNHCVLGVANEVALANGLNLDEQTHMRMWGISRLTSQVANWYGFDSVDPVLETDEEGPHIATYINDEWHWPFWHIAQAFRRTYLKDEK